MQVCQKKQHENNIHAFTHMTLLLTMRGTFNASDNTLLGPFLHSRQYADSATHPSHASCMQEQRRAKFDLHTIACRIQTKIVEIWNWTPGASDGCFW